MADIEKFIKNVLEEITGEIIAENSLLLLEEEMLDSMSILFLVSEIEDKYAIQIPIEDVVEENFKNIESIVNYVDKRMNIHN